MVKGVRTVRHWFWRSVSWWQARPLLGWYFLAVVIIATVFGAGYALGRRGDEMPRLDKIQLMGVLLFAIFMMARPFALYMERWLSEWD